MLSVPTLHSGRSHFERLFSIAQQVDERFARGGDNARFTFDFSGCTFLQQNAVVILGGLARKIERQGGTFQFKWDSLNPEVRRNLLKNRFMNCFDSSWGYLTQGHAVPYREHGTPQGHEVLPYLENEWLGPGWIKLSPYLRAAVTGNIWEIYTNAAEHAKSPVGVFSCGQHYPRKQLLKLTVADFGIGIPNNVRRFFSLPRLAAARALEWALKQGTSTRDGGRGLGLTTMKELVKANKGRLEIFSNDGYCSIDKNGETYGHQSTPFQGTIVNVTLVCDNLTYCFASETQSLKRSRKR